MDRQTVYSLDLWGEQKSEANDGQESNNAVQKKLVDFILSFAVDNAFIYRYAVSSIMRCQTHAYLSLQRPNTRECLVKAIFLRR